MIPKENDGLSADFTQEELPSKTYWVDFSAGVIRGFCDGLEAIQQAVYKILNTQRYEHLIYSWNYGAELSGLFGQPAPYVYSEIKRLVTEALTQDSRVQSVDGFTFEKRRGKVLAKFTVTTQYGEIPVQQEVGADV